MDKDRLNKLLDTVNPEQIKKTIDAISNMSDDEFARVQAKVDDQKAYDEVGLVRITLFLRGGKDVLLVQPSGAMPMWMLNLRSFGSLNWEADAPPVFTITDIAGEFFRFSAKGSGLSYWVDLIDEQQAQDLATFLGIGIGTEV